VITLFGRNPVVTTVVGAALLAIGLVVHALLLPWVGGALIVVGIVRFASGRGGGVSGSNRGRLR
jgi:membrane protein implicated in regulation of membrane protease activity